MAQGCPDLFLIKVYKDTIDMDMKLDLIAVFDPMKWSSFHPALAEEKMKEEEGEVAESHVH